MNVRNIVFDYLKQNGYDGLCTDDCGCGLDDLQPCGYDKPNNPFDCVPAYRHTKKEGGGGIYRGSAPPQVWYSEEKPE